MPSETQAVKPITPGRLVASPFGRSLALILLAFTLLPVLALVALTLIVTPVKLRDRTEAQMLAVSNLIQQSMTRWITAADDQIKVMLASSVTTQNAVFVLRTGFEVPRSAAVLTQSFAEVITRLPYFDRLYLVRVDGTVALSSDASLTGKTFGVGLSSPQGSMSASSSINLWGFDTLPLTKRQAGLLWRVITDNRQQRIGYLVGELKQSALQEMLDENRIGLGETGEAYVLGKSFAPVSTLRYAKGTQPTPQMDWSVRDVAVTTNAWRGAFNNYAGTPVIGAVQAARAVPWGWLVTVQHQSEALDVVNTLVQATLIFIVFVVIFALVASLFATRHIVTPLQILNEAAARLTRGQLNTRVMLNRRDEFGSLGGSFNAMATELERAFDDAATTARQSRTRADQLHTITHVGQHATSYLELDTLLSTIIEEIQRSMDYFAVRIYMPDDDRLTLRAQASRLQLLAPDASFPLDGRSSVSLAGIHRRLVNNGSQLAVPLVVGGAGGEQLLGVLEIQSGKADIFTQDEVEMTQILVNQIAIAIRNAELFAISESARKAADEASQLKSDFLSNMSHELRTPLNVIIGYSHSILNRPAMYENVLLPTVYRDGVSSIMTAGQHLLSLINDILDLSKIEAGQIDLTIEDVDPLPILNGVRQTAIGLVKRDVQLRVEYPDVLPRVRGDELRIRQILLNLLSNAAKFTEQGFITLDAQVQGDKLVFSVADTGSGIPMDARPVLFNRFTQASREVLKRYGGTGLGLSISRSLTLMQGGEIWFESEVGQGSTFYFSIPLADELYPTQSRPSFEKAVQDTAARVSVFDDGEREELPLMRQIVLFDSKSETRGQLQLALSEAGHAVLVADEPERALMTASALLPDAVVLHLHSDDDQAALTLETTLRGEKELSQTPILVLRDAQLNTREGGDPWWQAAGEQVRSILQSSVPA